MVISFCFLLNFLCIMCADVLVRLPEVKYDVETGNYTVDETQTKSLVLSESCPVATTCSFFDE